MFENNQFLLWPNSLKNSEQFDYPGSRGGGVASRQVLRVVGNACARDERGERVWESDRVSYIGYWQGDAPVHDRQSESSPIYCSRVITKYRPIGASFASKSVPTLRHPGRCIYQLRTPSPTALPHACRNIVLM